jgi:transposase-like protein
MEKIIQLDSNEVRDGTEGGRSPTGVPSLTSTARVAEGRESATMAAESGSPVPDPAVSEHPVRRRFTAEYKARILREADRTEAGQLGALLRREGLYASHLTTWRRQRDVATKAAFAGKRRGPKPVAEDPLAADNRRLRLENEQLTLKLQQAETIVEVQKKLSEVLGFSLTPRERCERQP